MPAAVLAAVNRELAKPDDEAISLEGIAEHHLSGSDTPAGGTAMTTAGERSWSRWWMCVAALTGR